MGLRKAQSSQPSSLNSPVPEVGTNQVPESKVNFDVPMDVLAERAPANMDIDSLAQEMNQQPQQNSALVPSVPEPSPSMDIDSMASEMLANDIDNDEADWWPRVKASFAITPRQEVEIYKAHYGSENVHVNEKGEIRVKKPGAKDFVPADDQMRTTIKDILGDGAGYVFRMLAQQATETAAANMGASAGVPFGGPGGSVAGGAVGAGLGMVASPLAADFASSKVAEMFGAQPGEIDVKNKLIVDGLVNLASAGAMKFVGTSLRNAAKNSPLNRIKALADVRKSVEGWVDRFGAKAESPAMLGEKVGSHLQMLEDQYGKSVGALNQAAINQSRIRAMSGGRDAVSTSNAEAKIKEVIEKYGGSLDPRDRSPVPFGKIQGKQALSELDNMLYKINAYKKNNGGIPMRDLIDFTRMFQQLSKFDEKTNNVPQEILSAYREVSNAFAKDRNRAFSELLTGTPSESLLKAMPYEKYENFMNDVGSLVKVYNKIQSPELFADSLIQKGNSKAFLGLVRTLGKDSEMVGEIKASWLAKVMDESIDSTSGIFNAKKFTDNLNSYGKDLLEEAIGKEDIGKLKVLAQRYSKISQAGLKTDDATGPISGLLADTWRLLRFKATAPMVMGNLIFRLTKNNASAVDYLANKGWYDAVESLPLDQQAAALASRDSFLAAMAGAKKQILPNGKSRYVVTGLPRSVGEALQNTARFGAGQAIWAPATRSKEKVGEQ